MFADSTVIATVVVKDQAAGKAFYQGKLGLKLQQEADMGVLVFQCGTGKLIVYAAPTAGTNQGTSAMWEVDDVKATVEELKGKGLTFERYDLPGMEWEGDVMVSGPAQAAWFKDPDGNTLSIVSKVQSA